MAPRRCPFAPNGGVAGADDITQQRAEEVEEQEEQEQEEKMADTELPKPEIIEVGTDASYLAWQQDSLPSRAT
jgi:hypothetical protein